MHNTIESTSDNTGISSSKNCNDLKTNPKANTRIKNKGDRSKTPNKNEKKVNQKIKMKTRNMRKIILQRKKRESQLNIIELKR